MSNSGALNRSDRPLSPILFKKLGHVGGWTKILSGSTYQNRRHLTISKWLEVWDHPKMLPFDFFSTMGQKRTLRLTAF
jgi:hypothetical protein